MEQKNNMNIVSDRSRGASYRAIIFRIVWTWLLKDSPVILGWNLDFIDMTLLLNKERLSATDLDWVPILAGENEDAPLVLPNKSMLSDNGVQFMSLKEDFYAED